MDNSYRLIFLRSATKIHRCHWCDILVALQKTLQRKKWFVQCTKGHNNNDNKSVSLLAQHEQYSKLINNIYWQRKVSPNAPQKSEESRTYFCIRLLGSYLNAWWNDWIRLIVHNLNIYLFAIYIVEVLSSSTMRTHQGDKCHNRQITEIHAYTHNRLLDHHPNQLNVSRATVYHRLHPNIICSCTSARRICTCSSESGLQKNFVSSLC